MPIVRINLLPSVPANLVNEARKWQEALEGLIESVQQAVASVEVLGITPDKVTVLMPLDLVKKGLGEELIVEILGLYGNPERKPAVIKQLASAVADAVEHFAKEHLPKCRLVEVLQPRLVDPHACSVRTIGEDS